MIHLSKLTKAIQKEIDIAVEETGATRREIASVLMHSAVLQFATERRESGHSGMYTFKYLAEEYGKMIQADEESLFKPEGALKPAEKMQ